MGDKLNLGFVNDEGEVAVVTEKAVCEEVGLKRNLGLFSGVSLIVGM